MKKIIMITLLTGLILIIGVSYKYEYKALVFPNVEINKNEYDLVIQLNKELSFYKNFYKNKFSEKELVNVGNLIGNAHSLESNELKKVTYKDFVVFYNFRQKINKLEKRDFKKLFLF